MSLLIVRQRMRGPGLGDSLGGWPGSWSRDFGFLRNWIRQICGVYLGWVWLVSRTVPFVRQKANIVICVEKQIENF